ncbi:prepilin-type N-terminal cleavage/methylation domain-containing protein [Thiovulum sp. ES]|nr:prepilin-type N-terminal cleavage/methylation domain-containing protein [Thiovulum sp. ES]
MRFAFSLLEVIIVISISSILLIGISKVFSNLYKTYFRNVELHKKDATLSNANLQLSKFLQNSISHTIQFDGKKLQWFGNSSDLNNKTVLRIANLNSSNSTHLHISEINISLFNEIISSFDSDEVRLFFQGENFSGNFSKVAEKYFFVSKDFSTIWENFEISFIKYVLEIENGNLYLSLNGNRSIFLENVSFFDFNSTNQKFKICISDLCQKQIF